MDAARRGDVAAARAALDAGASVKDTNEARANTLFLLRLRHARASPVRPAARCAVVRRCAPWAVCVPWRRVLRQRVTVGLDRLWDTQIVNVFR